MPGENKADRLAREGASERKTQQKKTPSVSASAEVLWLEAITEEVDRVLKLIEMLDDEYLKKYLVEVDVFKDVPFPISLFVRKPRRAIKGVWEISSEKKSYYDHDLHCNQTYTETTLLLPDGRIGYKGLGAGIYKTMSLYEASRLGTESHDLWKSLCSLRTRLEADLKKQGRS